MHITIMDGARPPQEIQVRQNGGFAGWLLTDGSYTATWCGQNRVWSTSSGYCGCMPTTSAGFIIATSCSASSVLVNPGHYTCPSNYPICYTMEYFQNPSDTAPLIGYGCSLEDKTVMIYKATTVTGATMTDTTDTTTPTITSMVSDPSTSAATTPTIISMVSDASTSAATKANSSSVVTDASTTSITTVNDLPQYSFTFPSTTTASPSSTMGPTKSNRAWIVGPIVGSFVGCIILLGLVFWIRSLYRRIAKQKQDVKASDNDAKNSLQVQLLTDRIMTTDSHELKELEGDRGVEVPVVDFGTELAGDRGVEVPVAELES